MFLRRLLFLISSSALLGLAVPQSGLFTPAHAAAPVQAQGTVTGVRVEGTRRIDEAAVLAAIGLRTGDKLNAQKVRRDLKAVYNTGWFVDVVVDLVDEDGGYVVVFRVKEKPAIREVNIEGEKKLDEDDILEVVDVRAFSVLNPATIADTMQKIRDLYIEKGYYLAEVEFETSPVGEDQVDVTFTVTENRKVVVQRVDLNGNDHIQSKKINRFLQIKEGGIAPWLTSTGNFDRDLIDADVETVRFVFLEEGFVDVQVDRPKVYLSPDKRFIFLSYHIEEGEQYDVGELDVVGDFIEEEGLTHEAAMQIVGGRQVPDIQEQQWRIDSKRKTRALQIESKTTKLVTGRRFKASELPSGDPHNPLMETPGNPTPAESKFASMPDSWTSLPHLP